MTASIGFFLLGFVICAILGVVFVDRGLFSISHKLDMFSQQTTVALSNINNPVVNSLINQATVTARAEGIDNGLQVSLLALYKMWEDGDLVDYESLSDVLVKNVQMFGNSSRDYNKWTKKFSDYQSGLDTDDSEEI